MKTLTYKCIKCGFEQKFGLRPKDDSALSAYTAGINAEAQALSYGWFYKNGETFCRLEADDRSGLRG